MTLCLTEPLTPESHFIRREVESRVTHSVRFYHVSHQNKEEALITKGLQLQKTQRSLGFISLNKGEVYTTTKNFNMVGVIEAHSSMFQLSILTFE